MKIFVSIFALFFLFSSVFGEENKQLSELRVRAENGDAEAQFKLGHMYLKGRNVEQDLSEAFKWTHKAAQQGYVSAQNNLGVMYAKGLGVEQNYVWAYAWLIIATETGDTSSTEKIKNLNNYMTIDQISEAIFIVGRLFYFGYGVDQNFTKAFKWHRKAALRGNAQAQYNFAILYEKGQGTEQDNREAYIWTRKAAEKGYPAAINKLGNIYADGLGVERDFVQAFEWWRKAAYMGIPAAQKKVAALYAIGRGVKQDYIWSYTWYNIAVISGVPVDVKILDDLRTSMNSPQLSEASRRIEHWLTKLKRQQIEESDASELEE